MSNRLTEVKKTLGYMTRAYKQTKVGEQKLQDLNDEVTAMWNDNTKSRDQLAFIGLELYRRTVEE